MSTHGHGRPRGRRRGGRRRAGTPPPETPDTPDQGEWGGEQPPPGYPPQDPPAYGPPPGQEQGGYGYQEPPGYGQEPGGYGYQPPQDQPGYGQEPGGHGYQAPPQEQPGYGPPPGQEPGGRGYQVPPQDQPGYGPPPGQGPGGYGRQAPPQEQPGYGPPPGQGPGGYGYQTPPQEQPGYGPPPGRESGGHGRQEQEAPARTPGEGRRRRSGPPQPPGGRPPGGGPPGQAPPGGGGRRAARRVEQQRKTKRGRTRGAGLKSMVPIPLLVTLVVLAVFIGVGELTVPEGRSQLTGLEPATASVTASRLVCPDAGGQQVGVVAPGQGKGEVTVQPIGSDTGSPLDSLRQAPARAVVQSSDEGAVVASAKGSTAQGFEAEQYGRKDKGSDRGLNDVRCVTPTTNWWFTGVATTGGNQVDLFLSNIDRSAATVDILAYGDEGAIDPEAGRGITVDPGQRLEVNVSELAPELAVSAIRVVVRTGRVAAAMRSQVKDGDTSYGTSWVPPTTPRKGNLVIPAVPSGAGKRKLVLFSPSEQDATVNVRLSTPDGSFAPAGHDKVDIPAQQAVQVDLGNVMAKNASALQVSSEIPLVAAVVAAEGGSGEDGDVAYSAGSQSLSSPATVALVPTGKLTATLHLTAPTKDAEVELRALTSKMSGPKRVKIGAGKTVPVKLTGPEGESTYGVSITQLPGSGPVYGSRVLTASPGEGPLMTVLPLQPGVREVTLPPVVPEVGAGVPR